MSVIVTGMEMPKSCRECCLEAEGYYCVPIEVQNKDNDVWLRTQYWGDIGERPDWCPLRPLPKKHGRLIDGDELANGCDDPHWCRWLSEIEDMPTIVEAEGE